MPVWSGPRRKLLAGGREEGLGQGRFCSSQLPKALPAVTAPHLLQKLSSLNSCPQVSGEALNKHRDMHAHTDTRTHAHTHTYTHTHILQHLHGDVMR